MTTTLFSSLTRTARLLALPAMFMAVSTFAQTTLTWDSGDKINFAITVNYGVSYSIMDGSTEYVGTSNFLTAGNNLTIASGTTLNISGLSSADFATMDARAFSTSWVLATSNAGNTISVPSLSSIVLASDSFSSELGRFSLSYFPATSPGGNANLNLVYTAIPEPSTYALVLGVATLGLVGFRRYRRRA